MTNELGTRFYAAPEQWERSRQGYGPKVDMYSLGVILMDMVRNYKKIEG